MNDEVDSRLKRIFCNNEDIDEKDEKYQEDDEDEEQVIEKESCDETESTFVNPNKLLETVNKVLLYSLHASRNFNGTCLLTPLFQRFACLIHSVTLNSI